MKKIIVMANYFYPEVASTSQLLTELCQNLSKDFEITVICAVPCYTGKIEEKYKKQKFYYENLDNIKIIRVSVSEFDKTNKKSRIKHILTYFFNSIKALRKVEKQDIVFTISQPPILGGILGYIAKKITKGKLIYNIQDFNPEQITAVSYSKSKLLIKILMKIDKFVCKKSDLVVVVGRDMQDTLRNRFNNKNVPNNVIINNWMDEKSVYPLEKNNENIIKFKQKYNLDNKFIFMYSGNIGLFYDLENIFKTLKIIKPGTKTVDGREVVFAFVGEGAVLEKLKYYKKEHNMENIIFIPYQDKKDLIYSLNAADIHFCINAKGIKGVSCPSKYYGIAAAGKPILGVLEEGTEVRLLIEETKGGLVSSPEDYATLEKNIKWFIENSNSIELENMGNRSRDNLVKNLTKDISIEKYKKEILKLEG